MKSVSFPQQTNVFAKDQPEYNPLPAHISREPGCAVVITSCWQMSFWERVKNLFSGRVFVSQVTFGQPLQPVSVQNNFNPPLFQLS